MLARLTFDLTSKIRSKKHDTVRYSRRTTAREGSTPDCLGIASRGTLSSKMQAKVERLIKLHL